MDNFDLRKYLAEGKLLKEELRDVEDILVKAGFRFDDGILGGIGSGGAGYYDMANDKIYGYNQSGPWNEEEFNKFYDNFEFNSNLYDREDLEDLEISQPQLDKGIYAVEDMGYVEIHSNGDVEIYATPQLSDEEGREFLPAFKMDANGKPIPQFSKDEMRKMLKDNGPSPVGKWSELGILEPVKDFKSRHASTLLTFDAVNDAIEKIK